MQLFTWVSFSFTDSLILFKEETSIHKLKEVGRESQVNPAWVPVFLFQIMSGIRRKKKPKHYKSLIFKSQTKENHNFSYWWWNPRFLLWWICAEMSLGRNVLFLMKSQWVLRRFRVDRGMTDPSWSSGYFFQFALVSPSHFHPCWCIFPLPFLLHWNFQHQDH